MIGSDLLWLPVGPGPPSRNPGQDQQHSPVDSFPDPEHRPARSSQGKAGSLAIRHNACMYDVPFNCFIFSHVMIKGVSD